MATATRANDTGLRGTRRAGRPGDSDAAWIACAVLLPGIASLVARLRMTDLAYHLRIGEDILKSGSIPSIESYTFTHAGTPWIDQQWGAQVIFALLHRIGGWEAITAARTLLTITVFALIYIACRARGASARTSALLSLGGFIVSMVALPMRPQLLALPILAAATWILASRDEHPRRLFALPIMAVVLANLHGSFVLLPALAGFAAVDDALSKRARSIRMLLLAILTAVATLANPFGIGAWTYAYDLATDPVIRNSITEWQPLDVSDYPGILVFISLAAVVTVLARRPRQVDVESLLTLGLLAFMALSAQRSIVLWGVVVPVVVAGIISGERDSAAGTRPRRPSPPAIVVIVSLLALHIALLPWWRSDRPSSLFQDVPLAVTERVHERLPSGTKLLVHQPWGSWFLWATPDIPLFLDSRIEIVPKKVWDGYDAVAFAGAGWREALERWDVEAIIAKKESWPLIPRLREDGRWRVSYEDDEAVLFVRS